MLKRLLLTFSVLSAPHCRRVSATWWRAAVKSLGWRHERDVICHVAWQRHRQRGGKHRCRCDGAVGRPRGERHVGSVADGDDGSADGLRQLGDGRRQPGRAAVLRPAKLAPSAIQLLHRVAGDERPYHRRRVDADLHAVPVGRAALGARRVAVRPVAVRRLHRLPLLHLHRVLHHHRPLLLGRSAGTLSQVANQAQGMPIRAENLVVGDTYVWSWFVHELAYSLASNWFQTFCTCSITSLVLSLKRRIHWLIGVNTGVSSRPGITTRC